MSAPVDRLSPTWAYMAGIVTIPAVMGLYWLACSVVNLWRWRRPWKLVRWDESTVERLGPIKRFWYKAGVDPWHRKHAIAITLGPRKHWGLVVNWGRKVGRPSSSDLGDTQP